jgi:hypothetical protein
VSVPQESDPVWQPFATPGVCSGPHRRVLFLLTSLPAHRWVSAWGEEQGVSGHSGCPCPTQLGLGKPNKPTRTRVPAWRGGGVALARRPDRRQDGNTQPLNRCVEKQPAAGIGDFLNPARRARVSHPREGVRERARRRAYAVTAGRDRRPRARSGVAGK